WKDINRIYVKSFLEDMKSLNIKATRYVPATKFMKEIIWQVSQLLKKGFAYKTENGIYYNISKFRDYGKLSKQPLSELNQHRIEPDSLKKNISDFSLWKVAKKNEPSWNSPFGKGRPGWHIEDTAIAMKVLGQQYELHGGGVDLIFPHHEAEIAQAEAISGKRPYVKIWIHCAFLKVEGRKMSKSLGNIISIKNLLENQSPETLRLLLLSTHFRKDLDFTQKSLQAANTSIERIKNFISRLNEIKSKSKGREAAKLLNEYKEYFFKALDNNFDAPLAITAILSFMREVNNIHDKLGKEDAKQILNFLSEVDKILGIIPKEKKIKISNEIKRLVDEREKARKEKNWRKADELREKLRKRGFWVEDTRFGPKIRSLKDEK
ncbi:MAG: cysteine--tRNA ligase, partial [Nanoarchaeota archaeon]